MNKTLNKIKNLNPKILILIFISVAVIIIASAFIEISQTRSELLQLMESESHSLLETLMINSEASLNANEEVEFQIRTRLLNNISLIKKLYLNNQISNKILEEIARENKLFRVNIFDKGGRKIFTNHSFGKKSNKQFADNFLTPLLENKVDTLIVTNKMAKFNNGNRFVVAVKIKDGSIIVLNLDAEKLLEFRKKIGFGAVLNQLTQMPNIEYIALQDTSSVLAASGNYQNLEPINSSEFLSANLSSETFGWRIIDKENKYFEAVHIFKYAGETVGLFRLGLTTESLDLVNDRIIRRVIIISIILFVFGSIVLTLIFSNHSYGLLEKQYTAVDMYSKRIFENTTDSLIITNEVFQIILFNKSASDLFEDSIKIGETKILTLLEDQLNPKFKTEQVKINIKNQIKYLLVSKSSFVNEKEETNFIIIIKDLTKLYQLQNKATQNEKLAAMGQLASGVAHEIRNPLNSISTISQQLGKDFIPVDSQEEFSELTKIIVKEVRRINETISSFLKFAKPEPIAVSEFVLSDLLEEINLQFKVYLNEKSIQLLIENDFYGKVVWDRNKIKQVFINLIENAADSMGEKGLVQLSVKQINDNLEIHVKDNGSGIEEEKINKIFDMYFTSKAKGTGIGLSIVQRIIFEHNGTIDVISKLNEGTDFIISIPISVS